MVVKTTLNNMSLISWRSVLIVEEIGQNHQPAASHWQLYIIILYRVCLVWPGFELTTLVVIRTDCICSCKSNYHTTTTVPIVLLHIAHNITMMLKVHSIQLFI